MLKKINFKKRYLLFLSIPVLLFVIFTSVSANSYKTANNKAELLQIMAEEIRNDTYQFKVIFNSDDTSFYDEVGLEKLFDEASALAGPYYEYQQRLSSIRVAQISGMIILSFDMKYETTKEQIDEIDAYVKREADKILATTSNKQEIVKKINEHLKSTITYGASVNGVSTGRAYSAYGAVKDHVAMSYGYTFLVERFFNYLNYESDIVKGMVGSNYDYWNIVKLDGNWYHLDVAANDQAGSDNYLLKSDSYMSSSRTWDYGKYPKATINHDFSAVTPSPVTPTKPTVPSSPSSNLPSGLHEYVYEAEKMGLLSDSLMASDLKKEMTREEFVEIILAVYESYYSFDPVLNKEFEDTTNPKIIKAYELGLINGVSATRFAPNSYLTREQACVILLKLITLLDGPTYYEKIQITDIKDVSSWAVDAMNYMVYNEIVAGTGGGNVSPKKTLIREHAIILAVRVYNIVK